MKRKYAKIDANQTEIVKALRQAGCSVQSLAGVGNGCPDLLVARNGFMWLMEVKDGAKCPSARKLTDDEIAWRQRWNASVHIVEGVEDALAMVSLRPSRAGT
jgi:Holliday junction resolvase